VDSVRPLRILIAEHRYGNTESRAIGAVKAGCDVRWVEPFWTDGLDPISARLQFRARTGPAIAGWNTRLLEIAKSFKPEVLWVESPLFVFPETYEELKRRWGTTLVCAYSDDPRDPKKISRHFEKSKLLFDLIFVTKDQLAQEFLTQGVRAVAKFWKGYDPRRIRPIAAASQKIDSDDPDVAFIGHPDIVQGRSARQPVLEALATEFEGLRVFGKAWARREVSPRLKAKISPRQLDGDDYPAMLFRCKIALQIPSRLAQDTHSSRSVEIPACGTLMLAERTTDHQMLFEEDKEAVFFSSIEELVSKCHYYLNSESRRLRIAASGLNRCIKSGYSNYERAREMLALVDRVRRRDW
jgi:spore maturation protein CgeB